MASRLQKPRRIATSKPSSVSEKQNAGDKQPVETPRRLSSLPRKSAEAQQLAKTIEGKSNHPLSRIHRGQTCELKQGKTFELKQGKTEPKKGKTCEPKQGKTDPKKGKTCEPKQGNTCEPQEGKTCELQEGKTCEPKEGKTCEPKEVHKSQNVSPSKEVRFQLSEKEPEDDVSRSSSLHDTESSVTGSRVTGDVSERSTNVDGALRTDSNVSVDAFNAEGDSEMCKPVSICPLVSGLSGSMSIFSHWFKMFKDTMSKTERSLSRTFGRDASDCVESGDVIQLVSRASGRPIQVVEDKSGRMTVDARGVFSTGVSDPVVINSSWGVLKDARGHVSLCHLNLLLGCVGGAAMVVSHAPGAPPRPEAQFQLCRRGDFVALRAADGSHVTFTADGDVSDDVTARGGASEEFSVNLVLTSMEVARGEDRASIVTHFGDDVTSCGVTSCGARRPDIGDSVDSCPVDRA